MTPLVTYRPLIVEIAVRGIAMIRNKPLAPDFATALEIVATATRYGARLMLHENFRFSPRHREIKRLVDSGAICDLVHNLSTFVHELEMDRGTMRI